MKRETFLTRQAENDLDTILDWISNRSTAGAKSWLAALDAALAWLEDHATSCPLAPENDAFEEEIRERLFKTKRGRYYRLLFSISPRLVRILHIRGPSQDFVSRD